MGYNWRSAHYFASRGDLSIQKFKAMPILILHGNIDAGNPVPLEQPAEISADIQAILTLLHFYPLSAPMAFRHTVLSSALHRYCRARWARRCRQRSRRRTSRARSRSR